METVHYFVRGLFRGIPETDAIKEQREELEAHLRDRIQDLLGKGLDAERAFSTAVSSLGDLGELIDTITGEKQRVFINKANALMMGVALVYGSLYLALCWFSLKGQYSLMFASLLCVPAWLGYAVPSFFMLVEFMRRPREVGLVTTKDLSCPKKAVLGWFLISAASWIVNLLFIKYNLVWNDYWAWMPTLGVMTWPLMAGFFVWSVKRLKFLSPDADE